jgi:glucan-binding YG repeat protein
MKTRMFHDLEARGRNWALRTPFNLVYGADAVLPSEIYLISTRVGHLNEENQAEVKELDSNLLEEKRNTTLANVWKYQESLKRYYNKSVVQREIDIGDLVLKKDIHTKDKHKFPLPWEGPFIDGGMLPNTWNADKLHRYYA